MRFRGPQGYSAHLRAYHPRGAKPILGGGAPPAVESDPKLSMRRWLSVVDAEIKVLQRRRAAIAQAIETY